VERGADSYCLGNDLGTVTRQWRVHAPPATSVASRPPPTVMMRIAIFFMMSSHRYAVAVIDD
jgi:hypothetical protein